ncbi:MAG TPA: IPT/TIG domain-containing protein [Blastocatellia bacterium]|nr:IPT/TIG domain-containing protein [Blastocatellia bacterium]
MAETLLSKPPHGKDHVAPNPTLTSIDPKEGSEKGGQKVTIGGTGFLAGAKLVIGDTEAQSVTVEGETKIAATTPPHKPGTVDVVITNSDGKSGALASGYTYLADETPSNGGETGSGDESGGLSDTVTPVTTPATTPDAGDQPPKG